MSSSRPPISKKSMGCWFARISDLLGKLYNWVMWGAWVKETKSRLSYSLDVEKLNLAIRDKNREISKLTKDIESRDSELATLKKKAESLEKDNKRFLFCLEGFSEAISELLLARKQDEELNETE